MERTAAARAPPVAAFGAGAAAAARRRRAAAAARRLSTRRPKGELRASAEDVADAGGAYDDAGTDATRT